MLSSLLPGLRELRAPLAAGYLWLLFAYFAAGTPTKVKDAPGPLDKLLTVLPAMGSTAVAVAVSFLAYLLGSMSQDLFAQIIPRVLARAQRALPNRAAIGNSSIADEAERMFRLISALNALSRQTEARRKTGEEAAELLAEQQKRLSIADEDGRAVEEARLDRIRQVHDQVGEEREYLTIERQEVSRRVLLRIQALKPTLDEARRAGASEAEKPEALRPMIEAEQNLLLAIIPPSLAIMIYLTSHESLFWLIGVAFVVALLVQAFARRVEAMSLASQAQYAREVEEAGLDLKEIARHLEVGEEADTKRLIAVLLRLRRWRFGDEPIRPGDDNDLDALDDSLLAELRPIMMRGMIDSEEPSARETLDSEEPSAGASIPYEPGG